MLSIINTCWHLVIAVKLYLCYAFGFFEQAIIDYNNTESQTVALEAKIL